MYAPQASSRPALAVRPVELEDAGGAIHLGGPDELSRGGAECRLGRGTRPHALPRCSVLHRGVLLHRGVRFSCCLRPRQLVVNPSTTVHTAKSTPH